MIEAAVKKLFSEARMKLRVNMGCLGLLAEEVETSGSGWWLSFNMQIIPRIQGLSHWLLWPLLPAFRVALLVDL